MENELDRHLREIIREFLLTLRSLIDWYLERLDAQPKEPLVEEIPIDYPAEERRTG
jgi:hypothetical protein